MFLHNVEDDLILTIFSFVGAAHLLGPVSRTCHRFCELARESFLWRHLRIDEDFHEGVSVFWLLKFLQGVRQTEKLSLCGNRLNLGANKNYALVHERLRQSVDGHEEGFKNLRCFQFTGKTSPSFVGTTLTKAVLRLAHCSLVDLDVTYPPDVWAALAHVPPLLKHLRLCVEDTAEYVPADTRTARATFCESLAHLRTLESLDVSVDTKPTDLLAAMGSPLLLSIRVAGSFSDEDLLLLSSLEVQPTTLQIVQLRYFERASRRLSVSSFGAVIRNFSSSLVSLHIDCEHVNDACLLQISTTCRQLESLKLPSAQVTCNGVSAAVPSFEDLRHLAMPFCDGVRDDGVVAIATHLGASLRSLDMSYLNWSNNRLSQSGERGIRAIADCCSLLDTLNLSGRCASLDGDVLLRLLRACPLRDLDLAYQHHPPCQPSELGFQLDEGHVRAVCTEFPALHRLSLTLAPSVPPALVGMLAERFRTGD